MTFDEMLTKVGRYFTRQAWTDSNQPNAVVKVSADGLRRYSDDGHYRGYIGTLPLADRNATDWIDVTEQVT